MVCLDDCCGGGCHGLDSFEDKFPSTEGVEKGLFKKVDGKYVLDETFNEEIKKEPNRFYLFFKEIINYFRV